MHKYTMKMAMLLTLLLVATSPLSALPRPLGRVSMGIPAPMSPEFFKSTNQSGFTLGAGIGKKLGSRNELTLDFAYSNFTFDVQGYFGTLNLTPNDEVESSATGKGTGVYTLFAQFKSNFPTPGEQRFVPYLFAEAGLFRINQGMIEYWGPVGTDRIEPATHSTAFGAGVGIGMNIAIEESTSLFVDIGATFGFTKEKTTSFMPLRFGVNFE
jgi:hypothetical protein